MEITQANEDSIFHMKNYIWKSNWNVSGAFVNNSKKNDTKANIEASFEYFHKEWNRFCIHEWLPQLSLIKKRTMAVNWGWLFSFKKGEVRTINKKDMTSVLQNEKETLWLIISEKLKQMFLNIIVKKKQQIFII